VLTDGSIWLFLLQLPRRAARRSCETRRRAGVRIISQNMIEAKGFNARDGTAIHWPAWAA
jgi:hypothetical protein